jgi:hypothetical protein
MKGAVAATEGSHLLGTDLLWHTAAGLPTLRTSESIK